MGIVQNVILAVRRTRMILTLVLAKSCEWEVICHDILLDERYQLRHVCDNYTSPQESTNNTRETRSRSQLNHAFVEPGECVDRIVRVVGKGCKVARKDYRRVPNHTTMTDTPILDHRDISECILY